MQGRGGVSEALIDFCFEVKYWQCDAVWLASSLQSGFCVVCFLWIEMNQYTYFSYFLLLFFLFFKYIIFKIKCCCQNVFLARCQHYISLSLCFGFRHLKDVILLTAIVQVLSTISSYFWYLWLLVSETQIRAGQYDLKIKSQIFTAPNLISDLNFFFSFLKKIQMIVFEFVHEH